jgi:hypothetical protein
MWFSWFFQEISWCTFFSLSGGESLPHDLFALEDHASYGFVLVAGVFEFLDLVVTFFVELIFEPNDSGHFFLFSSQFSLSILKNVLIKSNKVLILNKVEL